MSCCLFMGGNRMDILPIVAKQDVISYEDSLFHLPYPLPELKTNQSSLNSRKRWKSEQKKSLRSFLSKKRK